MPTASTGLSAARTPAVPEQAQLQQLPGAVSVSGTTPVADTGTSTLHEQSREERTRTTIWPRSRRQQLAALTNARIGGVWEEDGEVQTKYMCF